MGKGIQKRIQPDLVKEIEEHDGGSFSEKMRAWKLSEVEQTLKTVQNLTGSDMPLTVEDMKQGVREAIREAQGEY